MLSETDKGAVARQLAQSILAASKGRLGPWSITVGELQAEHRGPQARYVGYVLASARPLFVQCLLDVLGLDGEPATYLHNLAYYRHKVGHAGGLKQIPATIEFKRWPMVAKARVEVAV